MTADEDSIVSILHRKDSDNHDPLSYKTIHTKNAIQKLAFAPPRLHPCMIATAGSDGSASIITLSQDTYPAAASYRIEFEGPLTAVSFSEQGLLAVRCLCFVYVFQHYDKGALFGDVTGHWSAVARVRVDDDKGLCFAPGGAYMVAGGCILKHVIRPWQWEVVKRLDGPYDKTETSVNDNYSKICCTDWGSTGFIAIGRENCVVEIWCLKRGKLSRWTELKTDNAVCQIEWDKAGTMLAGIDAQGTTYLIRRQRGRNGDDWDCKKCN